MTPEEKQTMLDELKKARFSGALRVKFKDRDVTYRSDAEMAKAIRVLEDEIKGAASAPASYAEFGTGL